MITHTIPDDLWRKLKPIGQQNRRAQTPAEKLLWQRLRNRQVGGVKFRRQHVLNRFILDFASLRPRLCIEVDGPIHQYSQEHDAVRQEVIEAMGFRVIRFTNGEVIEDVDAVVNQILDALGPRSPK